MEDKVTSFFFFLQFSWYPLYLHRMIIYKYTYVCVCVCMYSTYVSLKHLPFYFILYFFSENLSLEFFSAVNPGVSGYQQGYSGPKKLMVMSP